LADDQAAGATQSTFYDVSCMLMTRWKILITIYNKRLFQHTHSSLNCGNNVETHNSRSIFVFRFWLTFCKVSVFWRTWWHV